MTGIIQTVFAGIQAITILIAFLAYRAAVGQITPVLSINCTQDLMSVSVSNGGLGPAFIRKISFKRWTGGDHKTVDRLVPIANDVECSRRAGDWATVLPAKDSVQLVCFANRDNIVYQWGFLNEAIVVIDFDDARGVARHFEGTILQP